MKSRSDYFKQIVSVLLWAGALLAGTNTMATPVHLFPEDATAAITTSHTHCAVIPWTILAQVPVTSGLITQTNMRVTIPSSVFNPTAISGTSFDCQYEISDILSFQIKLVFSGVDSVIEDNQNRIPKTYFSRVFDDAGPALFAHETPGASNIDATKTQAYTFHFMASNPGDEFSIESMTISASGNHYYVPVTEPGTFILVCIAAFGLVACGVSAKEKHWQSV